MAKEFIPPLYLVSPPITGQKVKDAQWLLSGHNRFPDLAPLKDAAIDGVYGPLTAQATKRAKYWLGYPTGACDQVFGQTLYEYLRPNDWRPLPAAYRTRRAARLAADEATPGLKALQLAETFIGVKESPFGTNCQMFGAWYRMNCVAWCAIFCSYNFGHTGQPSFRYSYVPNIWDDAVHNRNGLIVVQTPKPGDLAIFDWAGTPKAHVAFVKTVPSSSGAFIDLGGNTGPVNLANGGEVLAQDRNRSMVHGFVRQT